MSFDKEKILQLCNQWCNNTLMQTLEIEYIDAGEGFLTAKMPVNSRVHQPMGLLHGGATVALAESVGSAASLICQPFEKQTRRHSVLYCQDYSPRPKYSSLGNKNHR
jgi:acyl-coenzyme A thioesterase PaaI-like protein